MHLTRENKRGTLFRPSNFGTVRNGTKHIRYGCATNQWDDAMLAPIATLLFLSTLCFAVLLMAEMLFGASSRFAPALCGQGPTAPRHSVSLSFRARRSAVQRKVLRVRPQLRAAA
jgi:hypothetical protein